MLVAIYNLPVKNSPEDDMLALTPFLLFEGNCAEAMQFYQSCFGGDLALTRLADTPMKAQYPPEQHQKITYAFLRSEAVEFSATDWLHPTRQPLQGNTTAMYVTGDGYDELSPVFDKLRDGADAQFLTELRAMPFGTYGRLTDRYGVEWFFRGVNAIS
jgi:PhnB protein